MQLLILPLPHMLLPTEECGIVAQVCTPLAQAGISTYYICTFCNDHTLVSQVANLVGDYRRSGNFRVVFFRVRNVRVFNFCRVANWRKLNVCIRNFCRLSNRRKIFNSENFPIYGMWHLHYCIQKCYIAQLPLRVGVNWKCSHMQLLS